MPLTQAQKILAYLRTNGFNKCYLLTGELITKEEVEKEIEKQTTLNWN